jgi:hypothetical protein
VWEVSPEQLISQEQPDSVLVKMADGSKLVLQDPAVFRDTLSGAHDGTAVRIPLASVSELEVRQGDTVKTIVVVMVITVGVAAVAAGIFLATCDECFGGN